MDGYTIDLSPIIKQVTREEKNKKERAMSGAVSTIDMHLMEPF